MNSPSWLLPAVTRPLLLACLALLAGCAELGYYAQSIEGQFSLLASRQPLVSVIDDPATPAALRDKLLLAGRMREFASVELGLPRDGSYSSYVQLDSPYVVWSVVAAPPLSLQPRTWCFPLIGCVSYRGYFDERAARRFAAGLHEAGDDVTVGGVGAYSTLGWFDDPLTSSMLVGEEFDLAAVIFHELAHRRLYLAGATDFNEAYAVAVEREGVRRWLRLHGDAGARAAYRQERRRRDALVELLLVWRARLDELYRSGLDDEAKLGAKRELLDGLRAAYAESVRSDPSLAGAESWFGADLNNARLVSVATYHELVPAFERLLAGHAGDLEAFHAACDALAALPTEDRERRLRELLEAARSG